ncbi:TraX, partial [gut metagenome]
MSLPKTRFSCTTLKSIALVLMLLDHIHYFFAFTGVVPELFSMLGR